MSQELRKKLSLAHMGKKSYPRTEYHKEVSKRNLPKKGSVPWNKGRKGIHLSPETEFKPGRRDSDHPEWKGEDASYISKHAWVSRWKGKPDTCEMCGMTGLSGVAIHWANIDHKYRRVLDDYIRLCARCHFEYDERVLGSTRGLIKKRNNE